MSVSAFKGAYSNKLLRRLEKESRRPAVERQKGQVLILEDVSAFVKVIEEGTGLAVPPSVAEKALAVGRKRAKGLHDSFKSKNKRRYNVSIEKLRDIGILQHHKVGYSLFIVTSFKESLSLVKQAILDVFEGEGIFSQNQRADISRNIHKGHGVGGTAVSEVEIAGTIRDLSKSKIRLLEDSFDYYAQKMDLDSNKTRSIKTLLSRYSQVVTKTGKLKADYVSVVSFQEGKENIGVDSAEEKAVKNAFRLFLKDLDPETLINIQGSSTLKEKIGKVVVDSFEIGTLRVTKEPRIAKAKLSTKGSVTQKGSKNPTKATKARGGRKPPRVSKAKKGVGSTPLYLIGLWNQQLPETVAANMGAPGLENQSGRFASSVQITDITATPKGFPSVGYTYQKFPYQTFEPGYRQGSPDRDPRKLIDRSIREIAAQFAIGRFYTRRV